MTNMDFFGKMDPYCKFLIGNVMRRTPTVLKGGTDPYFAEAECEFWIGDTNWNKPLVFTVYDEDVGSDDLVGGTEFSLLDFFCQDKYEEKWYEIQSRNKKSGEVLLKMEFVPAGMLTIECVAGRNLINQDDIGEQDP